MKDFSVDNTQLGGLSDRSMMHTSSVVSWLRKRHQDTANRNYIYMPKEIQTHDEVKGVFNLFDEDKSGIK